MAWFLCIVCFELVIDIGWVVLFDIFLLLHRRLYLFGFFGRLFVGGLKDCKIDGLFLWLYIYIYFVVCLWLVIGWSGCLVYSVVDDSRIGLGLFVMVVCFMGVCLVFVGVCCF